jgi:hypothetical protein
MQISRGNLSRDFFSGLRLVCRSSSSRVNKEKCLLNAVLFFVCLLLDFAQCKPDFPKISQNPQNPPQNQDFSANKKLADRS